MLNQATPGLKDTHVATRRVPTLVRPNGIVRRSSFHLFTALCTHPFALTHTQTKKMHLRVLLNTVRCPSLLLIPPPHSQAMSADTNQPAQDVSGHSLASLVSKAAFDSPSILTQPQDRAVGSNATQDVPGHSSPSLVSEAAFDFPSVLTQPQTLAVGSNAIAEPSTRPVITTQLDYSSPGPSNDAIHHHGDDPYVFEALLPNIFLTTIDLGIRAFQPLPSRADNLDK